MSTSFLSLPTGWQSILMTRKSRLSTRGWPPGQEERDLNAEYQAGHIPGAVFFDIEALSDHTSPLPHMMPRAEAFAVAMRELGVSSDKHLVVYDEGNLFSAPRAWWMLRTFGVEKVSIVAGGLEGWRRDGLPLEQGLPNCRKVILTAASIRWRSSA
jgi:thiosulfate/3-mercaptopyruvate sulfurtransferase